MTTSPSGVAQGKFHGEMMPTTPSGRYSTADVRPRKR
jgi:hypothetical protein